MVVHKPVGDTMGATSTIYSTLCGCNTAQQTEVQNTDYCEYACCQSGSFTFITTRLTVWLLIFLDVLDFKFPDLIH